MLDYALWAYQTIYKTPIGKCPYHLVCVKACHIFVELENKAMWAMHKLKMDWNDSTEQRFNGLNEIVCEKICHLSVELEYKAYR